MQATTLVDTSLVWASRPDPAPAPGELLVAVHAAGINGADLMQRQGFYPAPPGWPADIPGMEFAGEVVGTGSGTTRFKVGDRVMSIVGGGAQAELLTVPEAFVLPVPDSTSWEEAGGFPEVFFTAYDALMTQARLTAGERVLISGCAGGVGTAAVQIAHAAGARVVGSVRNPDLHDAVRALGADEVIEPDQVPERGPYDVSLELVGAPGVAAALGAMAVGGRIVVIGVGAGANVEVNLLAIMQKRVRLTGSTLRGRTVEEKAEVARGVEAGVLPRLAAGEIKVPVAATYPMADANAAYERFAAGGKLGKIVLVVP
ncbi:MAG TPA: NAD(P)H-quinone oxidoreductase [Acidimicrobiales bacterium]|jgi:putative PIG3 family NAD(P)H quinone oxidoreductase|nr:NAD(P)H-quinone oxidoreductase [Acidimicrobiales bacterium]